MRVEVQRLRILCQQTEHGVVHLGDGAAEFVVVFLPDVEFLEI